MTSKKKITFYVALITFMVLTCSCRIKIKGYVAYSFLSEKNNRAVCLSESGDTRPEQWSTAVKIEDLPNLFKVSDALYRGAKPSTGGIRELKKLGIKTIVNLRKEGQDDDNELIKSLDMKYIAIPMTASYPDKEKFHRWLETVSNPANQPVFVHCTYGADRTGAAVALYRIKLEGWNKDDAIAEMVLGCTNFHRKYITTLPPFVKRFDE
ncbi:MAG: dual specificity protein phosphatase family protein [bacterium]|nr:dual specificity protein phosphatase family protein [bacterium]